MNVTVEPGNPRDPEAEALLKQSHALMQSLFPPEDNYFLDIDALTQPHIAFFVAKRQGETLGTAALAEMAGYGELKSMFVAETARGLGVGAALLERVETEARARRLPFLRLETGPILHAAIKLYKAAGFTERGPFGDYPEAANSVFMEKHLQ